jgi:type VI secretion system protein ImpM
MSSSFASFGSDNRDAPGWYGKLTALGDFAQRRLPTEFVQACDSWLSSVMAASREQLGESWLDVYLTAPVLRFAWAPGVFDTAWWFGVLMPSCDQVGRYFPLLITQRRARPPLDRIAFDHLELWFDQLARAAMETLHEGALLDSFEEALQTAPPWTTPGAPAQLTLRPGSSGATYEIAAHTSLHDGLHAMATHDMQARFAGCSMWWRQGDDRPQAALTVFRGLPDALGFAALLSGS